MGRARFSATRFVAGAALSMLFLWLAFRQVDWASSWRTIREANILWLAVALGVVVLTTLAKAVRWRLMFYPAHRHLSLKKFFSIFLAGQALNAAIPARVGEVARAILVGASEGVSRVQALWTAVIEKLLDTLVLLLFLAGISALVPLPPWLQSAGWTLSLASIALLLVLAVSIGFRSRANEWLEKLETIHRWFRRLFLRRFLAAIADSSHLVRRPLLLTRLLLWSLLAFAGAALTAWITGIALHIRLSYTACLLLVAVLQISAVVPIPTSPGRVGLFHYLCVISLAVFDVEWDLALSFGLVLHFIVYLPMTIGGPISLWTESRDWHDLSRLWRVVPNDGILGSQEGLASFAAPVSQASSEMEASDTPSGAGEASGAGPKRDASE